VRNVTPNGAPQSVGPTSKPELEDAHEILQDEEEMTRLSESTPLSSQPYAALSGCPLKIDLNNSVLRVEGSTSLEIPIEEGALHPPRFSYWRNGVAPTDELDQPVRLSKEEFGKKFRYDPFKLQGKFAISEYKVYDDPCTRTVLGFEQIDSDSVHLMDLGLSAEAVSSLHWTTVVSKKEKLFVVNNVSEKVYPVALPLRAFERIEYALMTKDTLYAVVRTEEEFRVVVLSAKEIQLEGFVVDKEVQNLTWKTTSAAYATKRAAGAALSWGAVSAVSGVASAAGGAVTAATWAAGYIRRS